MYPFALTVPINPYQKFFYFNFLSFLQRPFDYKKDFLLIVEMNMDRESFACNIFAGARISESGFSRRRIRNTEEANHIRGCACACVGDKKVCPDTPSSTVAIISPGGLNYFIINLILLY